MSKKEIVITDSNSPDYLLTFDELVFKGYDVEAERNQKESISIRRYPLCLYVAYKQILRTSTSPRLRYISDVQRYSTLLGHAILEQYKDYLELQLIYETACDSDDLLTQDFLDSPRQYLFKASTKEQRRAIKTLFFINESLEIKSNIIGISKPDLIILCSLLGLESALNQMKK